MSSRHQILFFYICLFIRTNVSVNILAITTLASPSHHLWHKALFTGLVEKGHNVTVLGHDQETEIIGNFTMLTLEGVYEKIHKHFNFNEMIHGSPTNTIFTLWKWDELLCQLDSETDAFKKLLSYPKDYKFDLIIWDLNGGYCLYPLIDRFGTPPVIATSPFGLPPFIDYIFGNHLYSYVPFFHTSSSYKTNVFERVINYFHIHLMSLSRQYYSAPREYELAKKIFGSNIRSVDEFERSMSLLLANTDALTWYPKPLPPNIIPVAGLHIRPVKKLPNDLEDILNRATDGAVLMNLGTNLHWKNFHQTQREAFLKAFEKLPQTILLKSHTPDVDVPDNVIVRQWLPQNDVLAHPNLKLFITHGGALSFQEAMHHGVPVIALPFFLDQSGYAVKIEAMKIGKMLDYLTLTPETVYNTIVDVLKNKEYQDNMKKVSEQFRDQPQPPLERAMFWIDYVLRHGTAEHLNPVSRDMAVLQKLDLDIIGVILGTMFILSYIVYRIKKLASTIFLNRQTKLKHS